MSGHDRAAQFAPFAALTGYDGVIAETGRLTDREAVLDVGAEAELDEKLRFNRENLADRPAVTLTYFQPDRRKKGGAYVMVCGRVKKLDEYNRNIIFSDGTIVSLDKICHIE